jgi:hypothetical protein
VDKMMMFSVPPGYVRTKPPVRPKLDPFITIIDKFLADDKARPKKQQHTAKRIFERLRDEHGFTGGITDRQGLCGRRAAALRAARPPRLRRHQSRTATLLGPQGRGRGWVLSIHLLSALRRD